MALRGTILVSDKQARLKPCLRCGYSLLHIAGSKNCPECGLAVRVSLSGNTGLEWTNPRWQRFLAFGVSVLVLGLFCKALGSAGHWIFYFDVKGWDPLSECAFKLCYRFSAICSEAAPLLCGMALCLMAKGERRYPDPSLGARRIMAGTGVAVLLLGLVNLLDAPQAFVAPS